MSITGRVAVALFVKNEQADIASWIAWHAAIGVQKFYIYDDHSTDETYEIIKVASRMFDIDLEKTDCVGQPNFYWRQRDAYLSACKKASGKEEWLALLDGDEYIHLVEAQSITKYVAQFQSYNAIALSWRIFGSSGRVLQEKRSPVAIFKAHSEIDFPDNRLVKSLIRPEQYSYEYRDPHRLIMKDEAYADAMGQSFEWSNSTKAPLWEGAIVNHYVCRSMESYINRIRRRIDVDLRNDTTYWHHFDRNEQYSSTRDDFLKKADLYVKNIKEACLSFAINVFNMTYTNVANMAWSIDSVSPCEQRPPKGVTLLKGGQHLEIDQFSRFMGLGNHTYDRIQGLVDQQTCRIWLFQIRHNLIMTEKFKIKDDPRFEYAYEFKVEYEPDGVYLRSPLTGFYLCSVPDSEQESGVYCNSSNAMAWEKFELIHWEEDLHFMSHSQKGLTYGSIFEFLTRYGKHATPNDLLLAVAALPDREQTLSFLKQLAPVGWIL